MEDFLLNVLETFGFPAVMCFYLITRTTRAIDNNTAALKSLTKEIRRRMSVEGDSE